MAYGEYYGFRPYVPQHVRRARALREMERRRKAGHSVSPVEVAGRAIATTFWGKAWCANLEGYSDYSNRLPRGRTYVRNGSVVHLEVAEGVVRATVSGSELYEVEVAIGTLTSPIWTALKQDCVRGIDSLVELLRGSFDAGVMERVCLPGKGLFPTPKEIRFTCSCPDFASMCKHVAAVLYGVGARLDREPELLFRLRSVSAAELVSGAATSLPGTGAGPARGRKLAAEEVESVFGVELSDAPSAPVQKAKPAAKAKRAAKVRGKGKPRRKVRPTRRK